MRVERLHFSVQALTDVSVCVFDRAELARHVARRPALVDRLDRLTAREIAASDARLTDLGRRSAHERVAGLLVQLYLRLRQRRRVDGNSFAFPLRQHHIADALGLTAVHVSRVLKDLKADGLVSIDHERLTIRDERLLRELSGIRDDEAEERL
jgi:CRP-like cAMP-binding protein